MKDKVFEYIKSIRKLFFCLINCKRKLQREVSCISDLTLKSENNSKTSVAVSGNCGELGETKNNGFSQSRRIRYCGLSQILEETTDGKTVFYVRGLELISREELTMLFLIIKITIIYGGFVKENLFLIDKCMKN